MNLKTQAKIDHLIQLLSNGAFHSGESIAADLGVSRAAVWKLIEKLKSWKIEIYSVRGKGYKIPGGLSLLEQDLIQKGLENNKVFKKADVYTSLSSTSDFLQIERKSSPGVNRVVVAEHQTQGRGRKGRRWESPFGANLYFSIGVSLPLGLSALGGLSIAVGINLSKTLSQFTSKKVVLKWPNDLLIDGEKLAGILVEASGESVDDSFLNIGIGINWDMSIEDGKGIDQRWCNLKSSLNKDGLNLSRNEILVETLRSVDTALDDYVNLGFEKFRSDWKTFSAFFGKEIEVHLPKEIVSGVEEGIESNGALILNTPKGRRTFHSGEVSVRYSNSTR